MIYAIKSQVDLVQSDVYKIASVEDFFNWANTKTQIEVDTETTGFSEIDNQVICIQFGDYQDQYVIERDLIFNSRYKQQLTDLFESDTLFLFQNALFDLKFLFVLGYVPKKIYDTFIAESCIHLGEDSHTYKRGLKDMAYNYLGVYLDKEIRGQIHWKGLSEDVINYAANDVKYLGKIKEKQEELISKLGIGQFVKLENEFVKALTYLTLSGINLDKPAWEDRCKVERLKLGELKKSLSDFIVQRPQEFKKYVNTQYDLFGAEFKTNLNFNSSQQVIELFLGLGLNLTVTDKKTGKLKHSVEANVLEPQKHLHELIPVYLDYKSQEKICSTYGENWLTQIHPKTGRIYTRYRQLLDTGRLSSGGKDKATKQEYLNFLNIPQDNTIRNCIIPKDGYVFVDVDYSGQETYVFAELSQESAMIEFLNNDGGDLHSFVAKQIYPELKNVSLDQIKKDYKQLRQNSKAANFAITFGGVGATIARNLSISVEEGNAVYDSYMQAFPNIKGYFKKCKETVLKNGYIVINPLTGARVNFTAFKEYQRLRAEINNSFWEKWKYLKSLPDFELNPEFIRFKEKLTRKSKLEGRFERSSYNFPVQGTAASMSKIAAIYVFNEIKSRGKMFEVLFPLMVHDQLVIECPKEESELWAKIVSESMVKAGNIFCKSVQIKAEPEILTAWKK